MLPTCFPHSPSRSPTKSGDSYWNLILKIVTFLWNIFINLHNLSGFWSLFACMCTLAREVFLKKTRVCFLRAVMTLCPAACDPGQFRNSTTNVCEECDYGFFQPGKWQDECLPCNDSYTTVSKASTSADQCLCKCVPTMASIEPLAL